MKPLFLALLLPITAFSSLTGCAGAIGRLKPVKADSEAPGRYQLVNTADGSTLKLDTHTGQTWLYFPEGPIRQWVPQD